MLPDLRFAVSAVLASTLLIVTAFGLAATVRVAQQRATSPDDTLRMLVYTDPIDWGRFFVEQRPIAAMRADAPAVDGAVPERAVVVTPDAHANAATPIVPAKPVVSIVMPEPDAAVVLPGSAAAPIAMPEAKATPAVANDRPAAPMVAPAAIAAAPVVPDRSTMPIAVANSNATASVVPNVTTATADDICGCEISEHEHIDAVKPVEQGNVVEPLEQVAVTNPLADGDDLTTSSVGTNPPAPSPSGAASLGGSFEPALEPSERVIGLPAFPNAGPGFVPPHDIVLPAPEPKSTPQPKSKPAAKPKKKKAARRRVQPRPGVEPPLATTGYPVPSFDKPWSVE